MVSECVHHQCKTDKGMSSLTKPSKVILEKEKQLKSLEERINYLGDEILLKARVLKEQKATQKSKRLHSSQNLSHTSHVERDKLLRPSDRGQDIRQYGKMDADIWKYDTLRDWFNTYATTPPTDNWSALDSGYSIRIDKK